MRQSSINPYIAVVIAVFAVSTTAVLVKLASGMPAGMIAFYRLAFTLPILAPIVLLKYRHEFKLLYKRDWILAVLSGLFFTVYVLFWFESLQHTSVTSSVVIMTLQPIFLLVGAYFILGERFSVGTFISLLIVLMGSFVIGWGDFQISSSALFGDILAMIGAIILAIYLLIGQKLRRRLSLITYIFIIYSSSVVFLFIYNLSFNNPFFGYSTNIWGWLILLALVPTFLGQAVFNWTLKWVNTTRISIALVFEPITAAILAFFILRENVTPFQLIGGTVIVFGLFLFIMSTTKRRGLTISKR